MDVLDILRITSILLTAASGILGVFKDFKEDDEESGKKKISKWGYHDSWEAGGWLLQCT